MQLQKNMKRTETDHEEEEPIIIRTNQKLSEIHKIKNSQVLPNNEPMQVDDNEVFIISHKYNENQLLMEEDEDDQPILDYQPQDLDRWAMGLGSECEKPLSQKVYVFETLYKCFFDNTYSGIMFLKRLTRVLLQFIFLAIFLIVFIMGYYVTLKEETFVFSTKTDSFQIQCQNCWINIYEVDGVDGADGAPNVHYRALGEYFRQVNEADDYQISINQTESSVEMQFINPFPHVKYLIIDLYIPSLITHFGLHCEEDSKCIVVINHNLLEVNELFNITGGVKSDLQLNVMNLQVPQFNLNSKAGGAVYLNHITATLLNLTLLSGPIVIQSKFDMDIQLSSNKHTFCMSGPSVSVDSLQTCYMDENTINYTTTDICYGQVKVCQESGCIPNQQFNIIANSSTLYVNLIQDVGMLQVESDKLTILSSGPFKQGTIKFDEPSQVSIQQALNDSQNADLTLRLNIGGSLLLQQTSNTYWSFFNNEAYAAFDPWWLSVLSASLLGTQIFEVDAQLQPGFCPYYPVLNQVQVYLTKKAIEDLLYTVGSATIYQSKDNRPLPEIQLNSTASYSGVEPLLIKQRNKIESWYKLARVSDSVSFDTLPYDVFFVISIALSVLSAIIFGYIAIRILIIVIFRLESYVIDQASQIQNYSATTTGHAIETFTEVIQRMLQKKEKVNLKKSPPMIYGVISYCLYVYAQSTFKNAAKVFCQTMLKLSSTRQSDQFYDQQLSQSYFTMDEKELKETYEQLCYLNKLRVIPLNEESELLKSYGFELEESKDTTIFLYKIKLNPDRTPYDMLKQEQINSEDSLELFMETQVLQTGIPTDMLAYDVFEQEYDQFCGDTLKKNIINSRDLATDYCLLISEVKNYELRKIKSVQENEYRRFAQNQIKEAVYLIRRDTKIFEFQQNPIKTIEDFSIQTSCRQIYNCITMFTESIRFNYNTRLFNKPYFYGVEWENNITMDYFDAVYMHGWLWNEIIIVLGNLLVSGIAILPILFFLMLINTAYAPFALYDPRSLMYTQDILLRPWLFFVYDYTVDQWVLVITIIVLYYAAANFLFQAIQYAFSYFPDEIGYMYQYKAYENTILKLANWFQWIQFIILYFCVFTYFGVIIVWLVLGAIINPNNYLVYTSSALTLVTTMASEYRAVQNTFEQGCETVNKFVQEIHLKTFGQVGPSLIKEVTKLSDKSNGIINSTGMKQAKEMAQQLGLGEEITELCMTTQQILNSGVAASIETNTIQFNAIKEKFIEAACAKFIKIATEQFQIKAPIAEQLVRSNFKFEDILDTLANHLQIESENRIPAGVILWILEASTQFIRLSSMNNKFDKRKQMETIMPKLVSSLLDTVMEAILIRTKINISAMFQQTLKGVVKTIHQLIVSKNDANTMKQAKILFQNIKDNANLDNQSILALELMFNYAEVLTTSPHSFEQIQFDLIQEILFIFNVDPKISFILQLVFSGGNQTQYKVNDTILVSASDIANQVIAFQQYYIPIKEKNDQHQFKILVHAVLSYIRYENLPIQEIINILLEQVEDIKVKDFIISQFQNNISWITNIGIIINLGSKNWSKLSRLDQHLNGINLELALDIMYLSSKYMWTLPSLDNFTVNQLNKPNLQDWDQEIWKQPAIQTPNRIKNLEGRKLIQNIAKTFQISQEAIIGLISILRGEIDNTKYHEAAYTEILKVIIYDKGNHSDVEEVKEIISLLSMKDFEDVARQITNRVTNKLVKSFLNLCTLNISNFVLFGGNFLLEQVIKLEQDAQVIISNVNYLEEIIARTEQLKEYLKQIQIKIQDLQKQSLNEDEVQFLNTYKAGKFTLYQYLKINMGNQTKNRQEQAIQDICTTLFNQIVTVNNLNCDYFLMIMELQTKLAQPSSEAVSMNLIEGLKLEPFKNLIYILQFKDTQLISKGLKYFMKVSREHYIGVDLLQISNSLQIFINAESSLLSIRLPNTVPYQLQQLAPLFINNTLNTRLTLSYSSLMQWIKTFSSMYPIHDDLKVYTKYAKNVEKLTMILFPSPNREQCISEVIDILIGPDENNKKLATFLAAILNKDYGKLINYLVVFFQKVEPTIFRTFFQKVTFIIQGLSSVEWQDNDDRDNYTIILSTQLLKYFLSFNVDAVNIFNEFFFEKTLNYRPNMAPINTLFSMFSSTPDYLALNKYFNVDEQSIRLADLIIDGFITKNKSEFLHRIQSTPHLKRMLTQKFGIDNFQVLIDLADIIEQNIVDIPTILKTFKLEPYPASTKLYTAFFCFNWQLKSTNQYSTSLQQYKKFAKMRAVYFNQDKNYSPDMLEILHWFGNPKPINFLYKVSSSQMMKPLGTTALVFSAIGSIPKYDIFQRYKLKPPQQLRYVMRTVNTLASKSVSEAVIFITDNTDNDLSESFQMLGLACGVDPVFAAAIINDDKNNYLKDIMASQQNKNKIIINKFLKQLNNYQIIDTFWRFYIIELETLQNALICDNEGREQLQAMVEQSQAILCRKLGLTKLEYQIIISFITEQAQGQGQIQVQFPLSTLLLLYSLKHLRLCAASKKDHPVQKYIKATHFIDLALTVVEKYLYFYDQVGLMDFNKPFLVRMITMSIFDTPLLRTHGQIDHWTIEKLLYPGMSDIFLIQKYYRGVPHQLVSELGYQCILSGKKNELKLISQIFIKTQQEYQNIFIPLISVGVDQVHIKDYQPDINSTEYIMQTKWTLFNDMLNRPFQKSGEPKLPNLLFILHQGSLEILHKDELQFITNLNNSKLQSMLTMQIDYILQLQKSDPTTLRFLRTKYAQKSLDYLKSYILQKSEQEILSSDPTTGGYDIAAINLMKYYIGQHSPFEYEEESASAQVDDQCVIQIEPEQPYILSVLVKQQSQQQQQQQVPIPKKVSKCNKQWFSIDESSIIHHCISLEEQEKLGAIINIMYNPQAIELDDFKSLWNSDSEIMNAIMMMKLRIHLEQSHAKGKFNQFQNQIPECFLYYQLGDNYDDNSPEYKSNRVLFKLGMDKLLINCDEIPEALRSSVRLIMQCYLGDVEAWYTLIMFIRGKFNNGLNKLSEQMLKSFIINCLLQLKQLGFRSDKFKQSQLQSQSLLDLLRTEPSFNLKQFINRVLIDSFQQNGCEFPNQIVSKFTDFLDFIINRRINQMTNSFMDVLQCMLQTTTGNQGKLNAVAKVLIQLLLQREIDNTAFPEYEQELLQLVKFAPDRLMEWKIFKLFLEIIHSNDLKIAIVKVSQLLKDNQSFKKYINLIISLNAIQYLKFLPEYTKEKLKDFEVVSILFYSFAWIATTITQKYQVPGSQKLIPQQQQQEQQHSSEVKQFLNYCQEFINNYDQSKFDIMLNVIKDIENNSQNSTQILFTPANIKYYNNGFSKLNGSNFFGIFIKIVKQLFDYKYQPQIQILISALMQLIGVRDENSTNLSNEYLEQFINALADHPNLTQFAQIMKVAIIGLSKIRDPKQLKSEDFLNVLKSLLQDQPNVMQVVNILMELYRNNNIDVLSDLPKALLDICCDEFVDEQLGSVPVNQIFTIATNTIELFQGVQSQIATQINEQELLKLIKPILSPMFTNSIEGQKDLKILIKCLEAFIALKQKKYSQLNVEFFQVMKISPQNSQLIIKMMTDFQLALQSPQNLIKEKLQSFVNPNLVMAISYMSSVAQKLQDNSQLSYEDMFKILDKTGQKEVSALQLLEFLQRIHIQITDHKFREVLVAVKKKQVQIETTMIDIYEFKELMKEISDQTMYLALEYLGISADLLMRGLILLIVYLVLVIGFILIGVQAFALPGTFASIINSILPILGGFGLSKQSEEDRLKIFNNSKINEIIKQAVKVIQSQRV